MKNANSSSSEFDDLRAEALRAVRELDRIADRFPTGDPARKILRVAGNRLKVAYGALKPQKMQMVLNAIVNGYQRFDELQEYLDFTGWDLRELLGELVTGGFVAERRVPAAGRQGGRPYRLYTVVTRSTAEGFGEPVQNLENTPAN
ncbi:MAG: hypothetical protein ACK4S4_09370 [Pyrinomonadaceae bacterium]